MIGPIERYSSTARKKRANFIGTRAFRVVLIAFALYLIVSRLLVSSFRIESVSMQPGLDPADRVIVSSISYGPRIPFSNARFPGLARPERGDLVIVQPPFLEERSTLSRILEPVAAFFTLQKATLHRDLYGGRVNSYMVKRVIGLPGDTVRMKDYRLSIKARGSSGFVVEDQVVPVRFRTRVDLSAPGWSSSLPFSGSSEEIVLKDDEYFVLGDNRPESSDSRSWGPVSGSRILGKVIFRYWPPRSFGKL